MKNTFDDTYFSSVYGGNYRARNPRRKIEFYLDRILRHKRSGSLLDIGCAYGLLCRAAASAGFDTTGVDLSAQVLGAAAHDSPQGIRYLNGQLPDFTMEEKFDVITCFDVLEHVENLGKALVALKKLLRDDSSALLFTVPVYDGAVGRIVGALDNDETHIHRRSRFFWADLLRENGFAIIEKLGMVRYFLMNRYYVHFGHPLLWPVSPAIFIIAKKIADGHTVADDHECGRGL